MEKIRNNGEICAEWKINLCRHFTKLKNRSMMPMYMCNDTVRRIVYDLAETGPII